MALNRSYELHHNFPKIAEESGFNFNTHKSKGYIDWAIIRQLDIDNLIRDRRFGLLEQHVGEIIGCALELEFDVRILDEGVVKLFRLAQLAVEYQQFCRRYLDQSVYVLREEIMAVTQELNILKKELKEKEDELKRARRKGRSNIRSLPYNGNENIANMILKTLSCRGDIFPTAPLIENSHQYNKCNFCDKVFMNQLYLKSHINRRHNEVAERDIPVPNDNHQDNKTLNEEIVQLKTKLHEMETMIENRIDTEKNKPKTDNKDNKEEYEKSNEIVVNVAPVNPEMKSVEVSTNNEDYFMSQIEKWKLEEREKYDKEIRELKQQILETVNVLKAEKAEPTKSNDLQKLHDIIKEQGEQILALKQELAKQNLKLEPKIIEKPSELEAEMRSWMQKTEFQSKNLENLMNSLNEITKEAKEARALAEAESARAAKLQVMLERNQSVKINVNTGHEDTKTLAHPNQKDNEKCYPKRPVPKKDTQLLEELQQKAKELLNVESSISSEGSSSESSEDLPVNFVTRNMKQESVPIQKELKKGMIIEMRTDHKNGKLSASVKTNKKKNKKENHKSRVKDSGNSNRSNPTSSPVRLVRVKLTEEVNNRLVDIGVDPLKSGLSQNVYNKQRNQFQKHQAMKSKNNPVYEKTRHALIAYLDTRLATNKQEERYKKSSQNKNLFSISNVLSNVKNRALSLVKQNEINKGVEKVDIIKRGSQMPSSSSECESLEREVLNKNFIKKNKKIKDTVTVSKNKYNNELHDDGDMYPMKESKSIETLIKSPVRKPNAALQNTLPKFTIPEKKQEPLFNSSPIEVKINGLEDDNVSQESDTSEDIRFDRDHQIPLKKNISENNIHMTLKQAKGVLKNASSISSLNKKKVLFDMDAIQMKSVSASPSQSTSVGDSEQFELGLVNLDDEWDISSIHESLKINPTDKPVHHLSPKIAGLKESIESQLARRTETMSTAPIGGVDVARGLGGSNTSLGSSLLDDEHIPVAAPRTITNKMKPTSSDNLKDIEDSDLDISEYSLDILKK